MIKINGSKKYGYTIINKDRNIPKYYVYKGLSIEDLNELRDLLNKKSILTI